MNPFYVVYLDDDKMVYVFEDGTCVISQNDIWLCGNYENVESATIAFSLTECERKKLQDEAILHDRGIVTYARISSFKK